MIGCYNELLFEFPSISSKENCNIAFLGLLKVLTRAQKDQGTPFSYSPFDPPSNKVPQIVEIIMLEYLRVPRNFLGLWPLRLRPSKLRLPGN